MVGEWKAGVFTQSNRTYNDNILLIYNDGTSAIEPGTPIDIRGYALPAGALNLTYEQAQDAVLQNAIVLRGISAEYNLAEKRQTGYAYSAERIAAGEIGRASTAGKVFPASLWVVKYDETEQGYIDYTPLPTEHLWAREYDGMFIAVPDGNDLKTSGTDIYPPFVVLAHSEQNDDGYAYCLVCFGALAGSNAIFLNRRAGGFNLPQIGSTPLRVPHIQAGDYLGAATGGNSSVSDAGSGKVGVIYWRGMEIGSLSDIQKISLGEGLKVTGSTGSTHTAILSGPPPVVWFDQKTGGTDKGTLSSVIQTPHLAAGDFLGAVTGGACEHSSAGSGQIGLLYWKGGVVNGNSGIQRLYFDPSAFKVTKQSHTANITLTASGGRGPTGPTGKTGKTGKTGPSPSVTGVAQSLYAQYAEELRGPTGKTGPAVSTQTAGVATQWTIATGVSGGLEVVTSVTCENGQLVVRTTKIGVNASGRLVVYTPPGG